jgi:uncharacterized protein YjbI with pentapeptide repeats
MKDNKQLDCIDFSIHPLSETEYDDCIFTNCNFNSISMAAIKFTSCQWIACNLSNAIITQTAFRDATFTNCKMLGLQFDECNEFLFAVSFADCLLNYSSFYKRALKKTRFTNCQLTEVDFTEADLSAVLFDNCNLSGAVFEHTNLENTDFSTAYHFSIHPELNKLKKTKFAKESLSGLLDRYDLEIE